LSLVFLFTFSTMTVRKNPAMPRGPTSEFDGDVKVSNKPPSKADLERVADLPILDANRKAHKFSSLYKDKHKVLIIFIRHFFCGVRGPPSSHSLLHLPIKQPATY